MWPSGTCYETYGFSIHMLCLKFLGLPMWLASETVAHASPFRLNQVLSYTHTNSGIVFQSFGSSESIREAPKEHLIIK
jgi:hypothetical protein